VSDAFKESDAESTVPPEEHSSLDV
jgi:hypothetical protein